MKKWICGILSLMLVLTSAFALADARMPVSRGALTDDADVLSSDVSSAIVEYLGDVKSETDVDVQVAIVHFLDGLDAQTYANQLFQKWELDDEAVLLLCAAGEDTFATAMGKKAENKLSKQNMDNLMYTSSEFANHISAQEYDAGFAKYFVALNDLINKRYDENLKLPKTLSRIASGSAAQTGAEAAQTTTAGSLWQQITANVQQNGQNSQNGQNGTYMPSLWYQTMQGVEDNSSHYTDYYENHDYGENGIGVGGWIILVILMMIIFSQSHPARKAKRNYRNSHPGKSGNGWLFGLLGLALMRIIRRR